MFNLLLIVGFKHYYGEDYTTICMMLDIVMGDSEKILKGALAPWIHPQLSIIIYHACLNAYS